MSYRSERVTVPCTRGEKAAFQKQAEDWGMDMSAMIRFCVRSKIVETAVSNGLEPPDFKESPGAK